MNLLFKIIFGILTIVLVSSCNQFENKSINMNTNNNVSLYILGNVQDAGSPHIGCKKNCCKNLFEKHDYSRMVVSLGLIDFENKKKYLFEATPNLPEQLNTLSKLSNNDSTAIPNGIFLTHAHIGHYAGLMYLGKEGMNSQATSIYVMPRIANFLTNNGPWSQLVQTKNISLTQLKSDSIISLSSNINIIPFLVPHRDEFSETVGYKIIGKNKSALFIPDINKWAIWQKNIIKEISKVDFAFIDGTFYDEKEINNRNMNEIPHPFVTESMILFKNLPIKEKHKVYFIHFNHTNPLLNKESEAYNKVINNGFNIAKTGEEFKL